MTFTPRAVELKKVDDVYQFVEVDPCLARGHFLGWDRYHPSEWTCEYKYDGERRVVQFISGTAYFTGRRRDVNGELQEKGANLYYLRKSPPELDGAIIDTEVYIPGGVSSDMTAIMACKDPAEAKRKVQSMIHEKDEAPQVAVFDVIAMPGRKYITKLSLRSRREKLDTLLPWLDAWGGDGVHRGMHVLGDFQDAYNRIIAEGGEGVLLKDLSSRYVYGMCGAWVKVKGSDTATLKCLGFSRGEGKYAHTLKSMLYEGTVNGHRVTGYCSGFTDAQRDEIWRNRLSFMRKPFEAKYTRATPTSLISVQFLRWREDL